MKPQTVIERALRRQVTSRPLFALCTLLAMQTLQTHSTGAVWAHAFEVAQSSPTEVEANQQTHFDDGPIKATKPIELNRQHSSLSTLFREPAECAVFASYGINDLTPIDILVKASDSDNACIKARFALSIKVEEAQFVNSTNQSATNQSSRPVLGYVPLEHVISVEESCPGAKVPPPAGDKSGNSDNADKGDETARKQLADNKTPLTSDGNNNNKTAIDKKENEEKKESEEEEELEMIVTFDCGKLSFTFRRDEERVYVSAIRGIVKLDQKIVREFVVMKPMFLTSDLDHHFKYDDVIEIVSEVQSKSLILTANFYLTEFEAFRKTTSRDFMKPPDVKSKPFSNEDFDNTSGNTNKPT